MSDDTMTFTPERREPERMLIQFPDTDGNPVFFDPMLVVAIRQDTDKSRNVRTTLITVGQPGGTSTVLRVMEGAQLVGDRVNLARRGILERIREAEAQRTVNIAAFAKGATRVVPRPTAWQGDLMNATDVGAALGRESERKDDDD